jgi:putative heme degradation protein
VLRRQAAFHLYEYAQGRARLTGDATCFEIDLAAIDSAWVVGGDTRDGCSRQLRLYDADGRALAIIAPVPTRAAGRGDTAAAHRRGEPHFWRSLMNALES